MLASLLVAAMFGQVPAQNVRPQIGYVYPPGGRAGTTVEVQLGSYDWTPDMQVLVRDSRLKIEITGPAGDWIMTPPPYWYGMKAGLAQPPTPREVPARITIPADAPPGVVHWQVANANGGSELGTFVISDTAEIVEPDRHSGPIDLPSLPVNASGRISRITEIDTYRFHTASGGLVTCRLDDRWGQPFNGTLTIRDASGAVLADAADTVGKGATVMFRAKAGATYVAEVSDVDHAGDRGYVYRLSIEPGAHVVTTVPLVVARGKTTKVEVVGWGVATGACSLESLVQSIEVPEKVGDSVRHEFNIAGGRAVAELRVDDAADAVEPLVSDIAARRLAVPSRTTGVLDRLDPATQVPLDRYQIVAKKGDALRLTVEAAHYDSPVDPSICIVAADGKEVVRNDDSNLATLDAAVDFKAPADGTYDVIVSDFSGAPPSRAHTYRLIVDRAVDAADLALDVPDHFDVALGDKADLLIKIARLGGWKAPVSLRIENLPAGVAAAAESVVPDARNDFKLSVSASDQIAAEASFVTVVATAKVGDRTIQRRSDPVLLSTKLKTRCVVKSAVQDGGRIVNRGTTYPADVLIERLEGYAGPVTLQMASLQQRQRRGIYSSALVVPDGVDRVQFPIFMPEWLETSLTARMILIGVVQVPDPKGNLRYVTGIMDGLIVMSIEGALLKVSHEPQERIARLGSTMELPIKVSRSTRLREPARIEIQPDRDFPGLFSADPITLPPEQSSVIVKVRIAKEPRAAGLRPVVIRATALEAGKWPAVSETRVPLVVEGR